MPITQRLSSSLTWGRKKTSVAVGKAQDDAERKPSKLRKPLTRREETSTIFSGVVDVGERRIFGGDVGQQFDAGLGRANLMSLSSYASREKGRPDRSPSELVAKPKSRLKISRPATCEPGTVSLPLARRQDQMSPRDPNSRAAEASQPEKSRSLTGHPFEPYESAGMPQGSWGRSLWVPIAPSAATKLSTEQPECSDGARNPTAQSDASGYYIDTLDVTVIGETKPFRNSKRRTIEDINWRRGHDKDLVGLSDSYINDASPADSAVGYLELNTGPYDDNGKGRAQFEVLDNPCFGSLHNTVCLQSDPVFGGNLSSSASNERLGRLTEEAWKLREDLKRHQVEKDRELALQLQEAYASQREEEEYLAAERAQAALLRECIVCGDTKDIDEFPIERTTSACDHSVNVCSECLRSWMVSEFETKGPSGLGCPECRESLTYNDVQRAASADTFAAYDQVITREALASLPGFEWCLGARCGSGQLNHADDHLPHYMRCASCGFSQCLKHKAPWHEDETCEQYDYRTSGHKARDEEAKTAAMLDDISKMCPGPPGKACGWRIQKTEGCDHMTCRRCKQEFCWICLTRHDEIRRVGNTAHKKDCKFHSHNLDVAWPFNVH
ncbi:E3 ubiquitin-protein ligase RNF14-like [Teratosphaeria destructans]|uniref:RBR-type E3 ubiquitin transferase n=1 Tax=Teratosphaeria destructans TaxID=418781 RepID=A0A9W7SI97_9PEZI|nr:E3 ubiquitin-protein ligase RNF14-like [Teratosphaeria destructans]